MAWNHLQSASGGTASSATNAVAYTSNTTAGSKLIAWVIFDSAAALTVSSVKDQAGNSFTLVPGSTASGTHGNFILGACYTLDTPTAGIKPTITVTLSGAANDVSMLIQEVSGLAAGDAHDGTVGISTAAAASSIAQPAYTSAAANEYLATFFGDNGNSQTATVPTGYTADAANITSSGTNAICVGYKNSTGGAESGTWTFTAPSGADAFIVVAFKLPAAGTVPGTVQPRAAVPVPRRIPARALWARISGQQAVQVPAPRQLPATLPRRRPARAFVQFTPVRTVNAVPPAPVSGTVQPRATIPVPRRQPGRGQWRAAAVPGITGVASRQQYQLLPRRAPARAFIRFIPVPGVNAVPAGAGRPVLAPDTESRLIRRYRRMLYRHGLPGWEPEVSMLAAPVAFEVPPGWPGTWPVAPPEPEPEPAPLIEQPLPAPMPKWRPIYTRPPRIVRARHVPRDAMMPVWRKG